MVVKNRLELTTKQGREESQAHIDPAKLSFRQSSPLEVRVIAGESGSSSDVIAYSREVHAITDEESATFGIEDYALKQAVEKYKGKSPNDAFVRGPTPWVSPSMQKFSR